MNENPNREEKPITGLFNCSGETAALLRTTDWSSTALGPLEGWPAGFRYMVATLLRSPAPQVILWGREAIMIYNDKYAEFAGKRHPSCFGKSCMEVWPEAAEFISNVVEKGLNGESLTFIQHPHTVYRNGVPEDIWMDLYCSPLLDDDGKPAGVHLINIETTGYIRSQQALRESEERFSSIFDQSSIGLAQTDLQGRFVMVNDKFCEMVGRPMEQLVSLSMQDITHPDDLPANLALFKKAVREGTSFVIEKRYIRPDGSVIWVNNSVSLVRNYNGKTAYITAIAQDITERKQAERYHKLFLAMCENSSDFIGIATPGGIPFYINPAGRKMLGVDKSEIGTFSVLDHFAEEDRAYVEQVILPAQEREGKWSGEFRFRNLKTGRIIPVLYNQFLVKDPETSELLGIATVSPDITERKKAEQAVKESEARFRIMADAAPNLVWTLNEKGMLTYMNTHGLNLLGIDLEQMIRDGWPPYVHPVDIGPVSAAVDLAFRKRDNFRFEYRVRSHTGEYRWLLSSANPIVWPDGTLYGYVGSSVDITELKQTEAALQEAEENWRTLANNIQNLAWTADPDGSVNWYNKQWYDYTGTRLEEVKGWGWEKVHHPAHIERVVSFLKEAWPRGEPWELTFPLRGADGIYRWFLTRAFAVRDASGNVIRWIGTSTNIDAQIRVEEELKRAQHTSRLMMQKKDEFMAVASHELKTPITTVKASLQLLDRLSEDNPNPAVRSFITKAGRQVDKLSALVSDLLDVSKIQAGKMQYHFQQCSLKEIIEDCVVFAKAETSHQVIIKGDLDLTVRADKHRLEQAVCNLLSNAVKYSPGANEVILEVKQENDNIKISVQDFGIGIEEEKIPYVFDRFFRVNEVSMKFQGLGLGLFITSEIIKRHGGEIWAESEVGKGSVFSFTIPVSGPGE